MASAQARRAGGAYLIIDALNSEWGQLVQEHQEAVRSWATRHHVFSSCLELDDVLRKMSDSPDDAFLALLKENADGDELAGRIVLQAMIGKLVRMAMCDRNAAVDDYVAAMWCQIRTFPLHSGRRKIPANLALDTLKMVRRDAARGGGVRPVQSETYLDHLCTQSSTRARLDHNADLADLTAQRVIATASSLDLIDPITREVLLSVYAEGLSGKAAAIRHQTSPAMIRFRCSKAVRRLAQHAASLAEAA